MKFYTAAILAALVAVASAKSVKERIQEFRDLDNVKQEVSSAVWD